MRLGHVTSSACSLNFNRLIISEIWRVRARWRMGRRPECPGPEVLLSKDTMQIPSSERNEHTAYAQTRADWAFSNAGVVELKLP